MYTTQKVSKDFTQYLDTEFNPETFYRKVKKSFNQKGVTVEDRPYTEVYSELILRNGVVEKLNEIERVCRKKSYRLDHVAMINDGTDQIEKTIAKGLCGKTFSVLGLIMEYEIPLQNTSLDIGGDIDLLSYNKDDNKVFLLELKKPGDADTLLRCATEIYTYWKRVNHEKLLADFDFPKDCQIIPAALVFPNNQAAIEYNDLKSRPFLKALLDIMNVHTFIINKTDIPAEIRSRFKI